MQPSEKLNLLRQELKKTKAYAYLVPTNDAFQNECRDASDERLAWLTGFDGSAGFGIITLEKAAVFVDGRYTLQVQNQIDSTLFEGLSFDKRDTWIAANTPANAVVLYDPWLFNYTDLKAWQTRAKEMHFDLRPTPVNLIDSIWFDRPQPQNKPAFLHETAQAGLTFLQKRDSLIHFLKQNKADALLIGNSESLNWLLNIRGFDLPYTPVSNMYGLFHKNGFIDIFCDLLKITTQLSDSFASNASFHDLSTCESFFKQKLNRKNIVFDSTKTPVALVSFLQHDHNKLILLTDPCIALRALKNPAELRGFRQSHRRDGVALVNFLAWISEEALKSTLTEIDAADYLEDCRREQKLFHSLSFPTIAGFGSNGAIIHYRATPATNTRIKPNNLLLVDSGAQYLDGTTDVTRTIAIGKPTPEHMDRFTRVLKGHIALAQAIFPPNTTGAQLDVLARQFLWQVGLDYNHGTGHGVGSFLNVHEGPHGISKASSRVSLEPGMIVSNEPGYYKTGQYGIRIESLVAIVEISPATDDQAAKLGFETLTLAPIDRNLIKKELLTIDEIAWLNSYHQHVYTHLSPYLGAKVKEWLAHATQII
ncbi:MAG: aminopeptidase P family protein [Pseudomonadota bacterium]